MSSVEVQNHDSVPVNAKSPSPYIFSDLLRDVPFTNEDDQDIAHIVCVEYWGKFKSTH